MDPLTMALISSGALQLGAGVLEHRARGQADRRQAERDALSALTGSLSGGRNRAGGMAAPGRSVAAEVLRGLDPLTQLLMPRPAEDEDVVSPDKTQMAINSLQKILGKNR